MRYTGAEIASVEVKLENTLENMTSRPEMQLLNAI